MTVIFKPNTPSHGKVVLSGTVETIHRDGHWLPGRWINGKYTVNLHFAETYEEITAPGLRVFSFNVAGQEFKDVDLFIQAGGALLVSFSTAPLLGAKAAAAGRPALTPDQLDSFIALQSDGTVVGWGDDSDGQTDAPPDLTNAVAIAAMISIFAALNGSILSGSRVPYAAARQGYFFSAIGPLRRAFMRRGMAPAGLV